MEGLAAPAMMVAMVVVEMTAVVPVVMGVVEMTAVVLVVMGVAAAGRRRWRRGRRSSI